MAGKTWYTSRTEKVSRGENRLTICDKEWIKILNKVDSEKLYKKYGFKAQQLKLAEECGELVQAICKKYSYLEATPRKEIDAEKLLSMEKAIMLELIDVSLLAEQFQYLYSEVGGYSHEFGLIVAERLRHLKAVINDELL